MMSWKPADNKQPSHIDSKVSSNAHESLGIQSNVACHTLQNLTPPPCLHIARSCMHSCCYSCIFYGCIHTVAFGLHVLKHGSLRIQRNNHCLIHDLVPRHHLPAQSIHFATACTISNILPWCKNEHTQMNELMARILTDIPAVYPCFLAPSKPFCYCMQCCRLSFPISWTLDVACAAVLLA